MLVIRGHDLSCPGRATAMSCAMAGICFLNIAEIAAEVIDRSTVMIHLGRILKKRDPRDGDQAVVLAYETGLTVPDSVAT